MAMLFLVVLAKQFVLEDVASANNTVVAALMQPLLHLHLTAALMQPLLQLVLFICHEIAIRFDSQNGMQHKWLLQKLWLMLNETKT